MTSQQIQLKRGEVLIGSIEIDPAQCDFPWYGGRFYPTAAFVEVQGLFEEELRLSETEDWAGFDAIWSQLKALGLGLVYENGNIVQEFLMHIEGERVWWREV